MIVVVVAVVVVVVAAVVVVVAAVVVVEMEQLLNRRMMLILLLAEAFVYAVEPFVFLPSFPLYYRVLSASGRLWSGGLAKRRHGGISKRSCLWL